MNTADGSEGSQTSVEDSVVLYSRPECHLCNEARLVVERECRAAGVGWSEVDIDSDADLQQRYGEFVPVVTVAGEQVGYWRIDPARLRAAFAGDAETGGRKRVRAGLVRWFGRSGH